MSNDDNEKRQADAGSGERNGVSSVEKRSRKAMLAQLRKYQGRLPADFKFDRDEANER